jgi:capsular exopolysaccharide synthesis family protein
MSRLAEAMKRASVEQEAVARDAAVIREKPAPPQPKLVVADAAAPAPAVDKATAAAVPAPERETVSAPRVRSPRTSLSAEKLVVTPSISPVSLEQYRRLAATLHRRQTETRIKTVLVASTIAGEGKTLTAVNLALTFSESYGRNVLLIDGDLRRPTTHDVLDVPNILGSGDGLAKETDQRLSLIQVSSRLSVLTAGQPDSDPTSRLASDRVRRVLMEAATQFDWVIVDTPPVGTVPDANLLATMADAVVLVIQAGKTPARLVQRTIDAIGRDRVMGVVLNGADDMVVSSDSSSSYLYRPTN